MSIPGWCWSRSAREDIEILAPTRCGRSSGVDARFIIFCDDLSFDKDETSYKSLKAILDGGLEGRPENVLFYATSNRRHLMPRDMIDNERATAIYARRSGGREDLTVRSLRTLARLSQLRPADLSRRWSAAYCDAYGIAITDKTLTARAIEWSQTRGGRSGRVAIQFVRNLAGEMGKAI